MSRTWLITGGAGFIGSHLGEALSAAGDGVRVIDDLSTGKRGNLGPAEFVEASITDADAVRAAVQGCAGVYHLAAIASVQKYLSGWSEASRTNLCGTCAVFEAAARAGIPVVYASSAAIYGDNPHVPLEEHARPMPISGYGADKLATEHHAEAMASMLGLEATGLRFFNVYGPRQDGASPYSGVISIFLEAYRSGRGVTVFGDGTQSRDFVYVGDVVRALIAAMAAEKGGALNVASGKPSEINHLLDTLDAIWGTRIARTHAPARDGDIRVSLGDGTRAMERLGFEPRVSLREGLEATSQWYRSHA